jgi:dirigent-like protein
MPRLPAVVAAAVATTILVVVLASSGSAQAPGERTLTFTARNDTGKFKLVDNPPKSRSGDRLSLGDMFVFVQPVFDSANERRVGRVSTTCTVIKRGTFDTAGFQCATSFRLRDGTIEAQGLSGFGRTTLQIAVVGGTQAHEGARGTFTASAGERTSAIVIHLLP